MQIKLLSLCFLTTMYLFEQCPSSTARELVFVQAIWRHGDRAPPSLPYPRDLYNETAWPRGWKKLTNEGIRQMDELGMYFRLTYGYFVPPYYDENQVHIRSSDVDRALTSAQAFLFGFYPAQGSFEWQKGNSWQPVPIHSATPSEPDLLLKPSSTLCKKVEMLVKEEYRQQANYYDVKYADFFDSVGLQSGISNFSYVNMDNIYYIQAEIDNYLIEKQPQWVNRRWPKYDDQSTMEIINELRRIQVITKFNGTAKAILMGGYLLNDWVNNVVKVANGSMKNPEKMLLYSSHEGTLLSLMYALGVANDRRIPYSTALIMEIYKDGNDYHIELLLRNETTKPPYLLMIEGCPSPCTARDFFKRYGNMVVTSYRQQQVLCGTPIDICNRSSTSYHFFATVLMLIFCRVFT